MSENYINSKSQNMNMRQRPLSKLLFWEDAFTNVTSLQVMYYLAKNNPDVEVLKMSKALAVDEPVIREVLDQLISLGIAISQDRKYTLTERGLASLYNFHTRYNNY